ncbi:MAG: sprT domain-containing protein [Oscillospiraceae bacterium]|nr:MAG: sprT domain-containing protein [Oscillospiraceae bacterium]
MSGEPELCRGNDPDRLLAQVIAEAKSLGIPVSAAIAPQVRINARARTRFGRCVCRSGRFFIELSARLLDAPEQSCRQTLAHEVLHTCPGCQNHQARWKSYAARMNTAFGYRIGRTGVSQELGIEEDRPVRYRLVCEQCGAELTRMRKSPLIAHPERYRCRCGGRLRPAPV